MSAFSRDIRAILTQIEDLSGKVADLDESHISHPVSIDCVAGPGPGCRSFIERRIARNSLPAAATTAHGEIAVLNLESRLATSAGALRSLLCEHIPAIAAIDTLMVLRVIERPSGLNFRLKLDAKTKCRQINGSIQEIVRDLDWVHQVLIGVPGTETKQYLIANEYLVPAHDVRAAVRVFHALYAPEGFTGRDKFGRPFTIAELVDNSALFEGVDHPYEPIS